MPEFDKDLNPVLLNKESDLPIIPTPSTAPRTYGAMPDDSKSVDPLENFFGKGPVVSEMLPTVSAKQLYDNKRYAVYNPETLDIEYQKHNAQSGWDRAGNATVNLVAKTGAYLTQSAGFLLGAPVALATWDITNMTDNFLVKAGDAIKEGVQETNPIYKGKDYTEGNIWQKLGTTDWWLDDAMDRVALTVATLAPGFAETELGVGLFGATVDEATGGLRATGLASKAIVRAAENPQEYSAIGKLFNKSLYQAAATGTVDVATNPNMVNLVRNLNRAELFGMGVVGQSGLNGMEALHSVKNSLTQARERGENSLTDAEIDEMASDAAVKGFWYTAPLALLNHAIELPMVFSSIRNSKNSMLNKIFNPETGEAIAKGLEKQSPAWWKVGLKAVATGFEHGQNESMQVAIGRTLEDEYSAKYVKDEKTGKYKSFNEGELSSIFYNYLDNVNDPNGQNNIALGTIQGIITTLFGAGKDAFTGRYTKEQQQRKALYDQVNQAKLYRKYYNEDFSKRDDAGNMIVDNAGNIQFDQEKLVNAGLSIAGAQHNLTQLYHAIREGNTARAEQIKALNFAGFAYNFLNDSNGVQHLQNILRVEANTAKADKTIINDVNSFGKEITPEAIYEKQVGYIDNLKKINTAIEQRHGGFIDLGIYDKKYNPLKKAFVDDLKFTQFINGAEQFFLNEKVAENNIELSSLGVTDRIESPTSPSEERANEVIDENDALTKRLTTVKEEYKTLIDKPAQKEAFAKHVADRENAEKLLQAKKDEATANAQAAQAAKSGAVPTYVTIKTERGDKQYEVGKEYFLGKAVDYDANGLETPISISRFTLLGDNGDGTLRIKDVNGERNVPKDKFAEYRVGYVDTLMANKTAKFFHEHRDTVYEYNFGKNYGGKKQGRLEYDSEENKLYFVYKDDAGKIKYKEVDNSHFVASEGFNKARITKVGELDGKLLTETPEQKAAREEFTSKEEVKKTREALEEKLAERRRVIQEVSDEAKARIESIDKKITSKRAELDSINKELESLREVKAAEARTKREKKLEEKYPELSRQKARFAKVFSTTTRAITKLSTLKANIENELRELNVEKSELEFNLSYFEDFLQNVEELPEKLSELRAELKAQVNGMEDLSISIGNQINQFSKMLKSIDSTIKDLVSFLQSSMEKFNADYPDYIRRNFEEMKENPLYEKVKELKEYMTDFAFIEDIQKEISINEDKVKEINDKIDDLYKQLDEIDKIQRAKDKVLQTFEVAIGKELQKRAEEAQLKNNEAVFNQILGTMNQSVQNMEFDTNYQPDPLKSNDIIGRATTYPSEAFAEQRGEELAAHHKRANDFGVRLENMPERDNIRGLVVTANTEASVIPGLTEFLKQGRAGVDTSKTVVMVMTRVNNLGKHTLIDQYGEAIPPKAEAESQDEYNARLLSSAIFQVFPLENKLNFRDSATEQEKAKITKEYTQFRKDALESKVPFGYRITPSLGQVETVKTKDENGKDEEDYTARTAVADSGLVSQGNLMSKPVIYVPTTEEKIQRGSTSFSNALGRVFLRLKNAYVKLDNRKHTEKEANTIHQVLSRLATVIYEGNKKGRFILEDSPEAQRLIKWLRTTVYWGTPKEGKAGYNSIWFDKTEDGFKLFMSGKADADGKSIPVCDFTPSGIADSKNTIISVLKNMYNNTNNILTEEDNYNKRYEQITGVDKNGNIESIMWPNYQSYLLSNKMPGKEGKLDGEKRDGKDIPLTTRAKPLSSPTDINRTGVYFIINDSSFSKKYVESTPTGTAITVSTEPAKKEETTKKEPTKQEPIKGKFELNGKTENTITLQKLGGDIKFVYDPTNTENPFTKLDVDSKVIENYKPLIPQADIDKLIASEGKEGNTITEEEARTMLAQSALKIYTQNQINADIKAVQEAEAERLAKSVEETPKTEDTTGLTGLFAGGAGDTFWNSALESLKKGKASEAIFQDAVQLYKDGKIKTIDDLKQYYANKKAGSVSIAPVSDVEAKKADIERRRLIILKAISDGGDVNIVLSDGSIYNTNATIRAYDKTAGTINAYQNGKQIEIPIDSIVKVIKQSDNKSLYDAELAALESGKPTEVVKETPVEGYAPGEEISPTVEAQLDDAWENTDASNVDLRVVTGEKIDNFEAENWDQVEKDLKEIFPNLPVYRVKNVIKGANGLQAWGMLKDGALYIYENAEVGTAYHEIFEAVWKMFTPQTEQKSILNEFKNREGYFIDRPTAQRIAYKDATPHQIKEQLAEEFRDYRMEGKIPPKPKDGRPFILKMFSDLLNFIRNFFTGSKAKNNTERLFEKIGKGYYNQKKFIPAESALSFAKRGIIDIDNAYITDNAELSEIPGFTGGQLSDLMQHMTFLTLGYMKMDNQSIFNVPKLDKNDIYGRIQNNIRARVKAAYEKETDPVLKANLRNLFNNVVLRWNELTESHAIYLKKYNVEFDENDNVYMNNENKTGRGEYDDSDKIDYFRKLNGAVKLTLATLPIVDENGKQITSTIGGVQLVPLGEAYISLMNNLHDSLDASDMLERIRQMARENKNYEELFQTLAKVDSSTEINWDNLQKHDIELITAFNVAFDKQNPDVKILNILPNGGVQVSEANLSTATRQVKEDFVNGIKKVINTTDNPFFEYSKKKNAYVAKKDALKKVPFEGIENKVKFLASLGIVFDKNEVEALDGYYLEKFNVAVSGIRNSMQQTDKIATIGTQMLSIDGRLTTLAGIKARIENPEFSSTFYGVNGQKIQTFIGTNPSSNLYKALLAFPTYESLQGHSKYGYLYSDSFAQNSVILNSIFDIDKRTKTGKRKESAENRQLMKPGVVNGMNDQDRGRKTASSKLSFRDRLIQELNMNLDGFYYNLVAGDASMEYMTYMGNHVTETEIQDEKRETINRIFRGYLIDEINLSRENRPVAKGRNTNDLRFMRSIIGDKIADRIVADKSTDTETLVDEINRNGAIDDAVRKFIDNEATKLGKTLKGYNILKDQGDGNFSVKNLAFADKGTTSKEALDLNLKVISANYIINNIEFHKVLYSDPYMYSDELKRIKNFLSPRQALISKSADMAAAMDRVWNEGYSDAKDNDGNFTDIARTDFTRNYFNSVTLEDVKGMRNFKGFDDGWDETDGGGMITQRAYRQFRIESSNWTDVEESQYRYDMAWEKRDRNLKLTPQDNEILAKGNPKVKSAYTPLKPIVAGSKADGKTWNDVVLDKFSLYPLSYRILKEMNEASPEGKKNSNAIELYKKMQKEDIDYAVFRSARKVGANINIQNKVYDENGNFIKEKYQGISKIPSHIISVQSEVPSKEEALVTRGSQATKLLTLDLMDAGVPVDFNKGIDSFEKRYEDWNKLSPEEKEKQSPLYAEIKKNRDLLEALTEEGYQRLLERFGIEEKDGDFVIDDISIAAKLLQDEVFNREVNSNIISALKGIVAGDVVLEATPAYQQIRNILYSIADKTIISPKISGGQKVQISPALMEETKTKEVSVNGKKGFVSDTLGLYTNEKGEKVCEIMVGRWFKSDMSDKDLLEYLNKSPEGQKILRGLAFRIPTEKQYSIDRIEIKQFLPEEFGDSVVIPSDLVKKVGSDFDIDKLSIYLKNVYTNPRGEIKIIPYLGIGEEARSKFKEMFEKGEFLRPDQMKELDRIIDEERDELFAPKYDNEGNVIKDASADFMRDAFADAFSEEQITKDFLAKITKEDFKKAYIDAMYKKSLENEYIQSSENLVVHPENMEKLMSPNSIDELKKLSEKITKKRGDQVIDYTNVGNMLDRTFMTSLRHDFVTGKYAIGIAATGQTNHAQNQRGLMYIDVDKFNQLSSQDKYWLTGGTMDVKDLDIKFDEYNRMTVNGKTMATLSKINNAAGKPISSIIAQFIGGYVDISKGPWIMQLGATPNVTGTWLFLTKIGVPIEDAAYFMNQPIIIDYLRSIENDGYKYLFMDQYVNAIKNSNKYKVDVSKVNKIVSIPDTDSLFESIGQEEFNAQDKARQHFMLDEFLKYAKMAEHLFMNVQGTNYDTANLNDSLLLYKKQRQFEKAQNTIISSPDKLLENSHIGKVRENINKVRDGFAKMMLKSDRGNVRVMMQKVLDQYIDLPDEEFLAIARRAVSDFFDFAVQIESGRNNDIAKLLLSDGNTSKQVFDFVKKVREDSTHPLFNNQVIKVLDTPTADRRGGVNNISIRNKDNKVYDQDQLIHAFRELRRFLEGEGKQEMYKNLVGVSVLQSGLSTTKYSFTSLLPYEDFKEVYNDILFKIEDRTDIIDSFYNLGVLQRNNWANDDIVPQEKAKTSYDFAMRPIYNRNMRFSGKLQQMIDDGKVPQLLQLSTKSRAGNNEYIVYSWEKGMELLTDEDKANNMTLKSKKNQMRKEGDYSFINKGLFRKVYVDADKKNPLTTGGKYNNYIYVMVNAWGDSFRANEFYNTERPSVIDNGFRKVVDGTATRSLMNDEGVLYNKQVKTSAEKSNAQVVEALSSEVAPSKEPVSTQPTIFSQEKQARLTELENKKKASGLSPAEMSELNKLTTEQGKIQKNKC